ncbi:MAG: protein tyrosine phosphatase family protein [Rhodocyclaceae bacterium]
MSVEQIIRFVPISDLLSTSGQPSEAQIAELAAAGYEHVINLALHDDPRYSLPDEPGAVRAAGMTYCHIPVPFAAPSATDFERFCAEMRACAHRKTLLHCAHNKRVSVFLALFRILDLGWVRADAVTAMQAVWQPDVTWQSFLDRTLVKAGASEEHDRTA